MISDEEELLVMLLDSQGHVHPSNRQRVKPSLIFSLFIFQLDNEVTSRSKTRYCLQSFILGYTLLGVTTQIERPSLKQAQLFAQLQFSFK